MLMCVKGRRYCAQFSTCGNKTAEPITSRRKRTLLSGKDSGQKAPSGSELTGQEGALFPGESCL